MTKIVLFITLTACALILVPQQSDSVQKNATELSSVKPMAGPCGNSPCTCKDPELAQKAMASGNLHAITTARLSCNCPDCKQQLRQHHVAKCDCPACKQERNVAAAEQHQHVAYSYAQVETCQNKACGSCN